MTFEITAFILGYLLGATPFGLLLTRIAGYGDIRQIGSGNIGTTNVLRTGNKTLALLTLLFDGGKGAFAVALVNSLGSYEAAMVAGFAAILGHMFPIWLKFKGGKGVATTLGMLLALAPWVGVTACLTWLAMAFLFRYSSLSALMAMLVSPLAASLVYDHPSLPGLCAVIAFMVWIKHRANIKRLLKKQEPKIGQKKDQKKEKVA